MSAEPPAAAGRRQGERVPPSPTGVEANPVRIRAPVIASHSPPRCRRARPSPRAACCNSAVTTLERVKLPAVEVLVGATAPPRRSTQILAPGCAMRSRRRSSSVPVSASPRRPGNGRLPRAWRWPGAACPACATPSARLKGLAASSFSSWPFLSLLLGAAGWPARGPASAVPQGGSPIFRTLSPPGLPPSRLRPLERRQPAAGTEACVSSRRVQPDEQPEASPRRACRRRGRRRLKAGPRACGSLTPTWSALDQNEEAEKSSERLLKLRRGQPFPQPSRRRELLGNARRSGSSRSFPVGLAGVH